jgi:hypothetical protein
VQKSAPKWEYYVKELGESGRAGQIEQQLNAAGADGLELVALSKDERHATFKRRRPAEDEADT